MTLKPKLVSFAGLFLLAAPAQAHLGHVGALAGHDHWIAGAAIGAAVAIGLWGAVKGKKPKEPAPEDLEDPTGEDPARENPAREKFAREKLARKKLARATRAVEKLASEKIT